MYHRITLYKWWKHISPHLTSDLLTPLLQDLMALWVWDPRFRWIGKVSQTIKTNKWNKRIKKKRQREREREREENSPPWDMCIYWTYQWQSMRNKWLPPIRLSPTPPAFRDNNIIWNIIKRCQYYDQNKPTRTLLPNILCKCLLILTK